MTSKSNDFRLLLHFDINKSIIMSDICSGRTMDQTLGSLLSECTWGKYINKPINERTAEDWVICCDEPSCIEPEIGSLTLGTYLEDYTLVPKKEQSRIKRAYTNTGSMGERFKPFHDKLEKALQLDCDIELQKQLPVLATGYYHIIPSFFRLIEYLADNNIEFNILFRTFGIDIENVCEEFNMFCSGQHPAYPLKYKLDGSDPNYPRDLRIVLPCFHGKIQHTSSESSGLHMKYTSHDKTEHTATGANSIYHKIMNNWFNIPLQDTSNSSSSSNPTTTSTTVNNAITTNSGSICSSSSSSSSSSSNVCHTHCAAIQDDFHWWHDINHENEESGKLLLVDHKDSVQNEKEKKVIQMFFDDNIERDRAHIVDVRDWHTYAPVPFSESKGLYLRRVEPYRAILEREYYVQEVLDVLQQYGIRIPPSVTI